MYSLGFHAAVTNIIPLRILHLRIALIRREVKQLAAIAVERAAQAESVRAKPSFRPLTSAEAETLVGGEVLAALGGGCRRT